MVLRQLTIHMALSEEKRPFPTLLAEESVPEVLESLVLDQDRDRQEVVAETTIVRETADQPLHRRVKPSPV